MITINWIKSKIRKYYIRFVSFIIEVRLQPIHIYLFHQVADYYDESTMYQCDFSSTIQFKHNIQVLKEKYKFISLSDAYKHITNDLFRINKYAVLTSDDGWASLKNILPWLHEQDIPVTLFLNPYYLDGKSFREKKTENYLSRAELIEYCEQYSTISVGMHGLEHINVSQMSDAEFKKYVMETKMLLEQFNSFVPFWAYTWGKSSASSDRILKTFNIVPVYVRGGININNRYFLDRELLDGVQL